MTATATARRPHGLLVTTVVASLVSGLIVAIVPFALGWNGYLWALFAPTAAAAATLAAVDARTLTLPNRLVAPLAAAAIVQVAGSVVQGRSPAPPVAAAAVVLSAYTVMAALGWLGIGDAKFAGAVTLVVGLYVGLLAIYLLAVALIISSVQIAVVRLAHRQGHRHPHGPAIAAAAVVLMVIGLAMTGAPAPS